MKELCGGCRWFEYLSIKGPGMCYLKKKDVKCLDLACEKWENGIKRKEKFR